ncbi:MAG: NADPH-dependent 7-cyano-7-deazaguanine reductase QueF [Chthonomonas sp.]|nr:NADPH-dependent 7-cyano-7-deazaguanine reductase QueF [Chthonomonas sp.]
MSPLETFPNPAPGRNYLIAHSCPEFTSVCPKTGLPDFATIDLEYIPDATCIELKSLKYYYHSFRDQGIFYEAVSNRLLEELAASCSPRWMRITGRFAVRGGISSVITVETGPRPDLG